MILIGIITRKGMSEEGHNTNIIYNDVVNAVKINGGMPIGIILNDNYKELIDMCDGVIFQGGDDFEEYDFETLKYIYEINKPVLGICLGMQLMGMLFNGTMINIKNHKDKKEYSHEVLINSNSNLYNIVNKNKLNVNSRHKSVLKSTDLKVSAVSTDGYIEAIEDGNKTFFIGVQWHPENMIKYDESQNNIFKSFINTCKIKKNVL